MKKLFTLCLFSGATLLTYPALSARFVDRPRVIATSAVAKMRLAEAKAALIRGSVKNIKVALANADGGR
jgi:hypothetical protein